MDQLPSYADERLVVGCVHCGSPTQTRDHVPSRILLDEPYPENLPVVPACADCNVGFSLDEEYFACIVECVLTGSVNAVERPKVRRILQQKPRLAEKLSQARAVAEDGTITFAVEQERVKNVILKLARGHAAFELSEPQHGVPRHLHCVPLTSLEENSLLRFEAPPSIAIWPEVGSRAMQRLLIADTAVLNPGWIDVQMGRYRYFASSQGSILVRFVISEFLACEVLWEA
jgi:hypothetical protein